MPRALFVLLMLCACYESHTLGFRADDSGPFDAAPSDADLDAVPDAGVDASDAGVDAGSDAGFVPCFCAGAAPCTGARMCCPATGTCEDPRTFVCSGEERVCP
ncbi:MAG: hypothetical protein AAGE52_12755 [Myxococcota bacterium]